MHTDARTDAMGLSGRIAAFFQNNPLTPLLALVAALLGVFAVLVTPREEEPQIDVTMANVIVGWPGASADDVEQLIAIPAEQVLSQLAGIEHVYTTAEPGLAMISVQFKVGVPRSEALVRIHDVVHANADWLPASLGAQPPIVKARGIDDVPVLTLTLWSDREDSSSYDLERVAHNLENELKRVPGTREIKTLGGPGRVVEVRLDAARLARANLSVADLRYRLQSANTHLPAGELVSDNQTLLIETAPFLDSAQAVAELVVGVHNGLPVYLGQIAEVSETAATPRAYVWHRQRDVAGTHPAVTLQITKKPGANAVEVAAQVLAQLERVQGVLIPDDMQVNVTRNYGETADAKARQLIQKLIFATLSVVALVLFALGRREAAIVGVAVILTLTATLFASWAWGFTLNRVSLFALIFSIGILVDDAIVVVENIHRHHLLSPQEPLARIIPRAVDEVGGPTILATLTVIAALLPMAFVSGLMGPYMSPIPINASMGMLLSLAIAFVLTPWLANRWLAKHPAAHSDGQHQRASSIAEKIFAPFLHATRARRNRHLLWAGVAGLLMLSMLLPVAQFVVLKMLPFDNKSEFQVVIDMPTGTALERTNIVAAEMAELLAAQPEVTDIQAYVGSSAPINFNGLVRQYDYRRNSAMADLQVNLLAKNQRAEQSHPIAVRLRPQLEAIAKKHGAEVNVVEVPPGPPVMAPIVAEIYGPDAAQREAAAQQLRAAMQADAQLTAVNDSLLDRAPRIQLLVDRSKAVTLGVPLSEIAATLRAGLSGEDVTWLHDGVSKYAAPVRLVLPLERQARLDDLLQLQIASNSGRLVALRELVNVVNRDREQRRHRKDGLPVVYVTADEAGHTDSPLYGLFRVRDTLADIRVGSQQGIGEYWIAQPETAWESVALKWDGEWQITYETFRDMGAAYGVGLILIYLLVVAQFKSYVAPLIIMAPIPLTLIGVMPGHALLGAPFTATSMIGMIALAGIIVRNSILLVDFIQLQLAQGVDFRRAVIDSAATRAQPILLTAFAAMLGAFFILDDPIFNGLAISLIFGVLISTLLTLVVIPLLYFSVYRRRHGC